MHHLYGAEVVALARKSRQRLGRGAAIGRLELLQTLIRLAYRRAKVVALAAHERRVANDLNRLRIQPVNATR